MNKYIRKYNQVVEVLIKKSFLSLRDVDIKVKERKLKKGSMQARRIFNKYSIMVHPIVRKAPKKALIGAFAHELTHLEDFRKKILWKF